MKNITLAITALCMTMVLATSCVSNKKYRDARSAAATNMSEKNRVQTELNIATDSINKLREYNNALGDVYRSTNQELNMSKEQIVDQQKRLQQLQERIDAQRRNTEALRKKITDALVGFNSNELTVSMKNGKVYVSMQESLLFPSGSAVVNQKGKDALAKVAGVLMTNPDINVEVEGHTDNKPIATKLYPDNWALSVARSTSIGRILIKDYSVQANRITASGRGEYDPIADNATEGGRAQNRRTEIILEPKLDELMQLIREGR
ncbi:MAG: flagellar motor protein MotB [Sphingobacteriales bacterium]|nr:MAG: flagellar motor protein MotB [Sphingobacteriales bacterium]